MTDVFLLTSVCPDDYDTETVLETGAVFLSLAGAQACAAEWADDSENGDQPRDLVWETGTDRWFCNDRSRSSHMFLIRKVALSA